MSMQDDILNRAASVRGRPAVIVVVAFIAGILLSYVFSLPLYALPVLLVVFLISSVVFYRKSIFGFLILSLFFILGFSKHTIENNFSRNPSVALFAEPSRNVLAWGAIVDRPRIREDRARFILRVDSLFDGTKKFHTTSDLLVTVTPDARYDRGLLLVDYGEYILVHGFMNLPAGRRNPYEPDFNRYLELHNIDALLYVRGHYNIEIQGYGSTNRFLTRFILPVRTYISGAIDRNLSGERAHFLRGLLLGDRSRISDDVRETFIIAGVIHVLAVSGLHVGIMTVIFFSIFGFVRVPRRARILLTIAGLIIFMFVTGAAPSVVRATIMASIVLFGFILERKSDIYNSIAVAALILLFHDTRELFNPSFQLSFAAVLSIVYLYPRFWNGVKRKFPSLEEKWLARYFIQLFLVSCAAQIGTLPFTAFYFERISIASFGANLFVIPGIFFVVSFGFASVILGLFSSFPEQIYGYVTDYLLSAILWSIERVSQLSFASVEVYQFGILDGLLFYSIIAVLVHITRPRLFRRSFLVCLAVLNIYVIEYIVSFDPEENRPHLSVTMLDVGQGDAIFIEFPDGKTMLYDAGPRTMTYDAGERIIVPFLKRHGVRYIDAAVISHAHGDHYGGLEAVLREIDVGTIYETKQPASGGWYRDLYRKVEAKEIQVRYLRAGDVIDGFDNVRIYVLHPAPGFIQKAGGERHLNMNNASIVLMIVYGDTRILFTGDAERDAENGMIRRYDDFLRAEILKAGHHGSNTSSTGEFVDTVSPETALISLGRINRFNHPGDEVIRRFEENDIVIYRTDLHGAVIVRSSGREYRVRTMR